MRKKLNIAIIMASSPAVELKYIYRSLSALWYVSGSMTCLSIYTCPQDNAVLVNMYSPFPALQ